MENEDVSIGKLFINGVEYINKLTKKQAKKGYCKIECSNACPNIYTCVERFLKHGKKKG